MEGRGFFLQRLVDTVITAVVFAAGVASLMFLTRTRSVLTWEALGLAFGAFLAFLAAAARIPASLPRSPGRHVVDTINNDGVHLSERQEGPDRRALRALGGRRDFFAPWVWTFPAPDERALASVLGGLRDLGVVFLGIDKGWSPGDVFEDLRERGLVEGPFEEIVWQGPGLSQVRRR
jgi:hypothetical protein